MNGIVITIHGCFELHTFDVCRYKGQEPMSYETLRSTAGLFFNIN